MRVPSEKFGYLKNGTIFFEKVNVRFHQTLASITYIKASQISDHRLSGFGRGLCGLAHVQWPSIFKKGEASKKMKSV